MKTLTPARVRCGRCESEELCIGGPCKPHCVECNYKPDCPECFDSRSVPAPDVHITATGTCGDCADMDDYAYRQYLAQYPLIR